MRGLRLAVVAIAFAMLAGCMTTANVDSYVSPTFTQSSITSIAVMPLTNQRMNTGQSLISNQRFIAGMRQKMPRVAIVAGPDAVQKINDANLADAWNNFIVGYSQTGLPNTKTLSAVAKVLDVDVIAIGSINRIKEQDASFYVYPYVELSLKYTFFDKSGTILWEASSDAKKEGYLSKPPVGEVLNDALAQIVRKLP